MGGGGYSRQTSRTGGRRREKRSFYTGKREEGEKLRSRGKRRGNAEVLKPFKESAVLRKVLGKNFLQRDVTEIR